ncbi:hypothetical protein [Nocardia alni]|uniref:hypothetical protein n=1 Tax=Nocardia alni TaxID=2815723 RepID=UPI001C22989B|nr:hypothetical protein [Nocardia alni]
MARLAHRSDEELRTDDELGSEDIADDMSSRTSRAAPSPDAPGIDSAGASPPAEPDDDDAEPVAESAGNGLWSKGLRRPGGTVAGLTVLTVAIIALIAITAVLLVDNHANDAHEQRDAAVTAAARRMVADLTTLNRTSVEPDITRILGETTGSFRDQFTHQADSFREVIAKGAVDSTGSVAESGVISADDDHAQVLVASTSTVRNSDAPNGQERVYRMKVSLQHVGGGWLVSDVEFVS